MLEKKIPTYYKRKVYIYTKQDRWLYEMPEYDIYLPEKYSKTMGFSVHGFNFVFSVDEFLTKTITPSPELINSTGGFEEISIISKEIFKIPQEKLVKTAIDSYIKKLTVNFIYESYFLYDKSNLIKETFITEINKKNINLRFYHFTRKLSKVFSTKKHYKK